MKRSLLLLAVLFLNMTYGGNIFELKLEKSEELEGTYSVLLSKNATAHIVLIRNKETKKYELTPYLVDQASKVSRLETYSSKEIPEIISHHQNNNTISLVAHNKSEKAV